MSKVDSIQVPVFEAESPGYEEDFAAWSFEQARRLRMMRIPGLDIENVAEEIESLGHSDKRVLRHRVEALLIHLLKWRYHGDIAGRGWASTILVQQHEIMQLLEESPSLQPFVQAVKDKEYLAARKQSIIEMGMFEETYPAGCTWTVAEILDLDFLPMHPAKGR